jgi:hypothetical protein
LPTLILCEKLSFFTPKINILEGNIKFGFAAVIGRKFPKFEKILSPFHNSLDKDHYSAWIKHHLKVLTYESGK